MEGKFSSAMKKRSNRNMVMATDDKSQECAVPIIISAIAKSFDCNMATAVSNLISLVHASPFI